MVRRAGLIALAILLYCGWRWGYRALFLSDALNCSGQTVEAEFLLESVPHKASGGLVANARFMDVKTTLYFSSQLELSPGDTVMGRARIVERHSQNSHIQAILLGESSVERAQRVPLRYAPAIAAEAIDQQIGSILPGEQAALLRGILLGNRSDFSDKLSADLAAVGMTHVVCVSGLHVSMLVGFVVLLVGNRRWAAPVCFVLIWLFVAVTGFSPSAVRAGVMITMSLAAPLMGREYSGVTALVAALFALLLLDPFSIDLPSTQLSFTATLGIILFSGKLRAAIMARMPQRVPGAAARFMAAALASSLSAMVFATPFAAFWMGRVALLSPLYNLLLLWLVNVIFIAGALAVAAAFVWWPAGYALAWLPRLSLSLFRGAIGLFARIPHQSVFTARPLLVAWLVFAYAMLLLALWRKRWRLPLALVGCMLVLSLALDIWSARQYSLEIAMLDVGQGQCIVLSSRGRAAVIDCGGDRAGKLAARYLETRGLSRVDALVLTQSGAHHTDGAATLAELVDVLEVYSAQKRAERTLTLGDAQLTLLPVLWPGGESAQAVLVTVGDFSLLVTGDINASGERWLTRWTQLPQGGLLVAGQHGDADATTQELLRAARPGAVLVSSDKAGPEDELLERLDGLDCEVYCTYESGDILVRVP